MERVIAAVAAVVVAAIGIGCMARPAEIQDYIIRTQSNSWAWKLNPFAGWMMKPSYRIYLRFMGIYFLLFAVLLTYVAYKAH